MATATPYLPFLVRQATGSAPVVFGTDTIKAILVADTYTPDFDLHEFYSDITNELVTGDGYTNGGLTLTTVSTSSNTTDDRSETDADDPAWTFTADVTFRYMIYFKDTGTPTTSPLIGTVDFGAGGRTENGTFTAQLPAGGFLQFRSSPQAT